MQSSSLSSTAKFKKEENMSEQCEQVPEAPSFRPTESEFRDPLAYINQIRPVAEQFGICKIIPPKSWRPKFCIDMNTFKFTPRVQRLNELEANSRIKLNFLDKLSKFWELQGSRFKIPVLERKPLDLYKLFKLVESLGGYEAVTKTKQWTQVMRILAYKEPTASRLLKLHYEKVLYPYLLFEAGVTMPANSRKESDEENLDDIDEKTG
jgi:histone demethylase JARID1